MMFSGRQYRKPLDLQVKKVGFKKNFFADIYHHVLAATWWEFFFVITSLYLCMNMFFAGVYFLGGDSIINGNGSFWEAFVFSFQTSTTIGYGHLRPANGFADAVVIFDTLSGIIFVAITTGLAFAKFSRPTARVVFTENCVMHTYDGVPTLMFRVANARDSHIANASIDAVLILSHQSKEGVPMQRIHNLHLVRSTSPVFFLSWMVMHKIDSSSPLYSFFKGELHDPSFRIVISLTGLDDWSAQMVHASHYYLEKDLIWDQRFVDILENHSDGSMTMHYELFNETKPVAASLSARPESST